MLFILVSIIIFLALLTLLFFFFIVSDFLGAPFVFTKQKEVKMILKKAKLEPGKVFYDLGSGDGRMVLTAVREHNVVGIGIEINPLLVWLSQLKARILGIDARFIAQDIFHADLHETDTIFIFPTRRLATKIALKIIAEHKKNCLVISHGFPLPNFDRFLVATLKRKPFPTYYYKLAIN